MAWLVQSCGTLLLLFFHKCEPHDGYTAYRRLEGKPWRVELPVFGECVHYRKRRRHKLEMRWDHGVFLGVKVNTTEKIVADGDGKIYVVQSIRRVPAEERYGRPNRKHEGKQDRPWQRKKGDRVNNKGPDDFQAQDAYKHRYRYSYQE